MTEPLISNDSSLAWLAWLFAYAIGGGLLGWFLYHYRMARQVRQWPVAPGTVLNASYEVDDGTINVAVEYAFEVGGVLFRGDRIRFGGGPYYRMRSAQAILARYPRGSRVAVRFQPSNPEVCALESHFEWLGWLPVLLFALAILGVWTYQLIVNPPPPPFGL